MLVFLSHSRAVRPAAYGSGRLQRSDPQLHYLRTANIRRHYTESQYTYTKVTLSAITIYHDLQFPRHMFAGRQMMSASLIAPGMKTNCFPRKDIAGPKSRTALICTGVIRVCVLRQIVILCLHCAQVSLSALLFRRIGLRSSVCALILKAHYTDRRIIYAPHTHIRTHTRSQCPSPFFESPWRFR